MFIANRLRSMPKRWDESSTLVFRSPCYKQEYSTYRDQEFEWFLREQAATPRSQSGFAYIPLYMVLSSSSHPSNEITSFFLYNGGK